LAACRHSKIAQRLSRTCCCDNHACSIRLPAVFGCLQAFHDRLKAEQDMLESYDTEESVAYIQVRR
jgi:hypothetical protein